MNMTQEILQAALDGLLLKRSKLDETISMVRNQMASSAGAPPAFVAGPKPTPVLKRRGRPPAKKAAAKAPAPMATPTKRKMSRAARARISAAQKARWDAHRANSAPVEAPVESVA